MHLEIQGINVRERQQWQYTVDYLTHDLNESQTLVDDLFRLGLSVFYDRVQEIRRRWTKTLIFACVKDSVHRHCRNEKKKQLEAIEEEEKETEECETEEEGEDDKIEPEKEEKDQGNLLLDALRDD